MTAKQVWILRGLRFLSFFFISFLLLSPLLKNLKKITREPLVIVAWDNSSSVFANTDSLTLSNVLHTLQNQFNQELGAQFTLVEYTFGEEAVRNDNFNFSEKKSHYGQMLIEVNNNHFNENLGALVVIGDGNYNQGRNPVNLLSEISFPVYTIGLGDTSEVVDSRIEYIRANRTAFKGNYFPIEVDVHFSNLKRIPLRFSLLQI